MCVPLDILGLRSIFWECEVAFEMPLPWQSGFVQKQIPRTNPKIFKPYNMAHFANSDMLGIENKY